MGGNSSKKNSVEFDTTIRMDYPVDGLKFGDVVTLRGEGYAGSLKYFTIDFCSNDDIAFHFKVIMLTTEGNSNKIKMNTRISGRWGSEVLMENIIYLNHHFELEFSCFTDYFLVDINGEEFYKYKHRVPLEKITQISLYGDAAYYYIAMPNKKVGSRLSEPFDANLRLPTREEVNLYVQNLTLHVSPLTDETNQEEIERLSGLMTEGLEITKTLLGAKKDDFLKNAMKYGGYLKSAFSAGGAIFDFIEFVTKFGEPSEMDQVIAKLDEIKAQLKKIEETIEKGFADVIEHMDLIQFREEVKIPVRTMFDLFIRCFTVRGKVPIDDFKRQCREKKSPREVFSAMYEFLDSKRNIFETHLKTQKYVYSVYDEWADALFNYATKLIVMNMFYYGIRCAEHAAAGNKEPLINEQDEIADLIDQLLRMDGRLKEIEKERMKTFHSGGFAEEFLRERFNKIKYDLAEGLFEGLPYESLPKIAYEMKNSWKGFNGPEDFYMMVVRGTHGIHAIGKYRYAGWDNADPGRVTVVKNIGKAMPSSKVDDSICLVLIQPVTKEIREATEKVNKEYQDKIKGAILYVHDYNFRNIMPDDVVPKVKEHLDSIPHKPLLIMYNTGLTQLWKQGDSVNVWPYNYELIAEAWSSAGGPCPLVYHWRNFVQLTDTTREMLFVFQ